jgi:Ni/Co efflux regulator RcnB
MSKIITAIALTLSISCSLFTSFLYADPPEDKGKKDKVKVEKQEPGKKSDHQEGGTAVVPFDDIRFEDVRRIAVANHCAGYESLPPGIRKNLARGKALPPGIAKKVVPDPVFRTLPVYPGYEWRVYGTDLVLVSIATDIIEIVVAGVFR